MKVVAGSAGTYYYMKGCLSVPPGDGLSVRVRTLSSLHLVGITGGVWLAVVSGCLVSSYQ